MFQDPDNLFRKYRNADAVIPDEVVVVGHSMNTGRFHAPSREDRETRGCNTQASSWESKSQTEARQEGYTPCQPCFASLLSFHARQQDSVVELREPPEDAYTAGGEETATEAPAEAEAGLPDEVAATRTAALTTYHRIVRDGQAVACDNTVIDDCRTVDRAVLGSHYDPCNDCFAEPAIEAAETTTSSSPHS